MKPKFSLGKLYATPGALEALHAAGHPLTVARHAQGDWGDLGPEDRAANDEALRTGGRIFSSYDLPGGGRVWVITEADRSSTTVLLPDEY